MGDNRRAQRTAGKRRHQPRAAHPKALSPLEAPHSASFLGVWQLASRLTAASHRAAQLVTTAHRGGFAVCVARGGAFTPLLTALAAERAALALAARGVPLRDAHAALRGAQAALTTHRGALTVLRARRGAHRAPPHTEAQLRAAPARATRGVILRHAAALLSHALTVSGARLRRAGLLTAQDRVQLTAADTRDAAASQRRREAQLLQLLFEGFRWGCVGFGRVTDGTCFVGATD